MSFSSTDNIIDSRDIIARIEELESFKEDLDEAQADYDEARKHLAVVASGDIEPDIEKALEDAQFMFDEDAAEELGVLQKLAEEGSNSTDWHHGEALVNDGYFTEYAKQFAEDIEAMNPNGKWPLNCIDWDEAVEELKQDYFDVEFDGSTFWIRY